MDTEQDFIRESREAKLNANEKDFLEWLSLLYGIDITFKNTPDYERWNIMSMLKDSYWEDYLDDLEYAYRAKIVK